MSDQPVSRPLPTHRTTQTRTRTFKSWVGFEPTITASQGAKTVHVLDRAATVISKNIEYIKVIFKLLSRNFTVPLRNGPDKCLMLGIQRLVAMDTDI
jgi:hypothetical protein